MTFDFTAYDGHLHRLDTEGGQVHDKQLDADFPPQSLEPSDEEVKE